MKILILLTLFVCHVFAAPPSGAVKYRSMVTREAQFLLGLNAPIPMIAAQIEQESAWRPGITAWDNGRGLAQFMDPTTDFITKLYPELGKAAPYSPAWAIPALIRYDVWIYKRVKGDTECHRWAAALKGYNAGLGYVQQAQKASDRPGIWFDATEFVKTKQSAKNFEYSRMYPRWILFKRQLNYTTWGAMTCHEYL